MKNLILITLIFVSLVSKGQSTINITSNTTIGLLVNYSDEYIISDNVELTVNGPLTNYGGKFILLGCNSKITTTGGFTGVPNNVDIERHCNDCANLNNFTQGYSYNNGYLNVSNLSYVGVACMTPLPVELLNMGIDCNNKTINWSTVAEINNDYFTVKYSSDAVNWVSIGEVDGQGNSSKTVKYDYPITTNGYYMVGQTDFDGTNEYFDIFYCGNIDDEVVLISTYNLLCQVVSNSTRGLVVELYSNGTTKKILR